MRARPPWSSPSIDHTKPSTPIGTQLFKEETPYPISGNSASSSKVPFELDITLTFFIIIYYFEYASKTCALVNMAWILGLILCL